MTEVNGEIINATVNRVMGKRKSGITTRQALDFDVRKRDIYINAGGMKNVTPESNMHGLWNERDGQILGVVSKKYNIISHNDVLTASEDAMQQMGISPTNVKYWATPNKNMMWADIKIADKNVMVNGHKDNWDIGYTIRHGLDGKHGADGNPYIERTICSNGLRSRVLFGNMHTTHKATGLKEWFLDTTTELLAELDRRFMILPKMAEIPIQIETFEQKVEKMLGKRFMQRVSDAIRTPPEINPLYSVDMKKKTISVYDGLSVLTYINHQKDEQTGAGSLAIRYGKIENIVQSYIKG